jgi:hypothetical protein
MKGLLVVPCPNACKDCPQCDCGCDGSCNWDCHQITEGNRAARRETA